MNSNKSRQNINEKLGGHRTHQLIPNALLSSKNEFSDLNHTDTLSKGLVSPKLNINKSNEYIDNQNVTSTMSKQYSGIIKS